MADLKKPRLNQVASNIQLGKSGPVVRNSSGVIEFRNSDNSAYGIVRGADPVNDEDAVPKRWALDLAGDSLVPPSDISESTTTGLDFYSLPSAVAGDIFTYTKQISQQITNILRISPASGDKISAYGNVIDDAGYLQVNSNAFTLKFIAVDSTHWVLISDLKITNFGESVSRDDFSLVGRDTWVSIASNTAVSRAEMAGFSLNGYGYATNGTTNGSGTGRSGQTDRYDDTADTWTTMTADPNPRWYPGTFTLNGFGYVSGGFTTTTTGLLNHFNDALNTWNSRATNSVVRFFSNSLFSVNGCGYACVGNNGAVAIANVEQYNDATNAWTAKTANPTGRYYSNGWTLNGYGYVVGGDNGSPLATVNQYNDLSNAWSTKKSLNVDKQSAQQFILNNYGIVNGGSGSSGPNGVTEQYNDALNAWTTKATSTTKNIGASFAINGYGYTTLGRTAVGLTNDGFQYN